jgi:phospholipase C
LPNVSYLDPKFAGEEDGTSADDHPLADIRAGDAFLSQVFTPWPRDRAGTRPCSSSTTTSGAASSTMSHHAASHREWSSAPTPPMAWTVNSTHTERCCPGSACRIEGRQAAVNHTFYDHTSVLKLIEWRWGL